MDGENHEQHEGVYFMERALTRLRSLPHKMQNQDYKVILKLMGDYIQMHCNHNIISDLIDIDPDRSKTILYCDHCHKTFD
jgi:hypothetical protein